MTKNNSPRLIGAHLSAAGGIDKAVQRAADIGCNCVQIFSASPRVWKKPPLESYDTLAFFLRQESLGIRPVVTHGLYLINLASENPEQIKKSQDSLIFELQFDALIQGAGVVVHLGSHQGRGWDACKDQLARTITAILEQTPESSTFLIENSAGQNGKLCSELSEIRWLLDMVKSPRLKWCLDTCHAHAAGYYLSPDSPMKSHTDTKLPIKGELASRIDQLELWKTLQVVHLNDSKDPFASGRDRHENIGDGLISSEDLAHFLQLKTLESVPLMTEAPGLDGNGPDAENITRIKKLVNS